MSDKVTLWIDKGNKTFLYHQCDKDILEVSDWIVEKIWRINPTCIYLECHVDSIDEFACELMSFMRDEFGVIGHSCEENEGYTLYFMEE
jgi:hypothetical protein